MNTHSENASGKPRASKLSETAQRAYLGMTAPRRPRNGGDSELRALSQQKRVLKVGARFGCNLKTAKAFVTGLPSRKAS